MVIDLHTRLRSAIEERLALAEAATPGPWAWEATGQQDNSWGLGGVVDGDGESLSGDVTDVPDTEVVDPVCYQDDGHLSDAAHIAANDPTFTIRACRADLARLERHRPQDLTFCEGGVCWACDKLPPQPCPEVRSLAEVWEVEL